MSEKISENDAVLVKKLDRELAEVLDLINPIENKMRELEIRKREIQNQINSITIWKGAKVGDIVEFSSVIKTFRGTKLLTITIKIDHMSDWRISGKRVLKNGDVGKYEGTIYKSDHGDDDSVFKIVERGE